MLFQRNVWVKSAAGVNKLPRRGVSVRRSQNAAVTQNKWCHVGNVDAR